MKRVLIIGNSGSGKTWLGNGLSAVLGIPHMDLDDIFWEPGGYNRKRSDAEVDADLTRIRNAPSWIVEGVFGHLAERLTGFADTLIHMDLPWGECKANLLERGSESSKALDSAKAEENFRELLEWASAYDTRDTQASGKYHGMLFDRFCGMKIRVHNRSDADRLLREAGAEKRAAHRRLSA